MLRDGARTVVGHFSGVVPEDVVELMTIAGIGRYTAGAIASIAYGQRAPIVDGNVARIVSRLAGSTSRWDLRRSCARRGARRSGWSRRANHRAISIRD